MIGRWVVIVSTTRMLFACSTPPEPEPSADEETVEPALPPPVPQEVLDLQQRAVGLLGSSDFSGAINTLREAISGYPNFSGLHINLGIAHARSNQDQEAEKAFKQALEIDPDLSVAHNYLGILKRKAGQFAAARQSYQRAILIDKTYSLAHLNLGILCDIYLQDLDCALKHYQAYETLEPTVSKQFKGWKIDLERRIRRGS